MMRLPKGAAELSWGRLGDLERRMTGERWGERIGALERGRYDLRGLGKVEFQRWPYDGLEVMGGNTWPRGQVKSALEGVMWVRSISLWARVAYEVGLVGLAYDLEALEVWPKVESLGEDALEALLPVAGKDATWGFRRDIVIPARHGVAVVWR